MEVKLKFPDDISDVLEKPVEKSLIELIAIGLYRDGKITLSQTADIIGVTINKMSQTLKKHDTYLSYGLKELEEDMAFATNSE